LSTIVTQNKNIYIKDVIVRNCVASSLQINAQPEPTFFIFNSQFLQSGGAYGIYISGRYYDIRSTFNVIIFSIESNNNINRITNVTITGYTNTGIRTESSAGNPTLSVTDTFLSSPGGYNNGNYGIYFNTIGTVTLNNVDIRSHYYQGFAST
jgi:hypothetical protein